MIYRQVSWYALLYFQILMSIQFEIFILLSLLFAFDSRLQAPLTYSGRLQSGYLENATSNIYGAVFILIVLSYILSASRLSWYRSACP